MASNNQATDDSWSFSEGVFTGSFFFDVLANDSIKKPLYSIDNGQVADLGTADLARSAAASSDRSALGATIWITGDGRIGYSADSLHDLVDQLGQGETLTDSFLYAVRQGNTLVWATARLTITGTNDAPVATADVAAANEDMLVTGSVAANDHDVDHGAVLTYSQIGTTPGFAMASNGNWAFDGSDPAYQSLGAGESMQVAISYSVTDEHGAAASSVLAVTVTGTNDAVRVEYAVQDAWLAEDGGSMAGTIVFSDADLGDVHSVSVTPASNEAAVGTFVLDPVQPYDPAGTSYVSWHYLLNSSDSLQFLNEGEEISEQYVVTISDGHGGSVDQTITVVMRGSDDAPISEPAFAVASEDVVTSGRYTSSDIDHDATLTYSLYSQFPATYVPGFSIGADGTWSLDGNNPEIQSLAEGQTVSLVLHIVATDEYGMFDINELTISLTGKNDAAVIGGNATGSVAESAPGNPGVAQSSGQLTVADVDGNAGFRAVGNAVSDGGHGTFSLSATGSWIYTLNNNDPAVDHLNSGQQLTDSFKVVAVDGTQSSVTITIAGANDFSLPTEYLGTD
ncbi:MAG TPA: VCBS domain-containing protein, partial [Sphingomicrobium sp.]|nr:VCBS domain-containing protein [Sphingomicrobium sp.]